MKTKFQQKKICLIQNVCLLLLFLNFNSLGARTNEEIPVRIEDVVKKVSTVNFKVYQNALKVYQAQKSVSVARANLLPKLNIWNILSLPLDPRNVINIVGDIAPFLIPSNWFNLDAESLMYQAEREAYKVLWANEVMTAKALYIHLLFDQNLLLQIRQNQKEIKSVNSIVRSHEILGGTPLGASRELEIRLLALEEDARSLKMLIADEASQLAYMMGYGGSNSISPVAIMMPSFDQISPLSYEQYESKVIAASPELRQYGYIIEASKYVKKTAQFSIFGVNSTSRGVANGVFDSIPIQDGLGFGTGASIEIAKTQTEILKVQKLGAEETIKRQLKLLVTNYNLDIENYVSLKKRVELTKLTTQGLLNRMKLGEDIDSFQLVEASRNHIQANMALFSAQYRFLINQDRFRRMLFVEDYAQEPMSFQGDSK